MEHKNIDMRTETRPAPEPRQTAPPGWVNPDDLTALEQAAAEQGTIAKHTYKHHIAVREDWCVTQGETVLAYCPLWPHHTPPDRDRDDRILTLSENGTRGDCPSCGMITTSLDAFAGSSIGGPRYDRHSEWTWSEEEVGVIAERLGVTLTASVPGAARFAIGSEMLTRTNQTIWKENVIAEIAGRVPEEQGRATTLEGKIIYEQGQPYLWNETPSGYGMWKRAGEDRVRDDILLGTARDVPAALGKRTVTGVQMTAALAKEMLERLRRFVPQTGAPSETRKLNYAHPHHPYTLDRLPGQQFSDGVVLLHGRGKWDWHPESNREQIYPQAREYPLHKALRATEGRDIDAPTGVPLIDEWLRLSFPDPESRRTALEIIGSLAYGRAPTGDRKIFLYIGSGGSGKSVLCDLIYEMLPDYAIYSGTRRLSAEQYFESRLDGRELMIMREYSPMNSGKKQSNSGYDAGEEVEQLKRVTGDTAVTSREVYERTSEKNLSLVQVMLVGNKDPDFSAEAGDIKALERRFVALRATAVPEHKQMPNLIAEIKEIGLLGIPVLAAAGMHAYNSAFRGDSELIDWTQGPESREMVSGFWVSQWDILDDYVKIEKNALMPNVMLHDLMVAVSNEESGVDLLWNNDEEGKRTATAYRRRMKAAHPGVVYSEKSPQKTPSLSPDVQAYLDTKNVKNRGNIRCWRGLILTEKGQQLLQSNKKGEKSTDGDIKGDGI